MHSNPFWMNGWADDCWMKKHRRIGHLGWEPTPGSQLRDNKHLQNRWAPGAVFYPSVHQTQPEVLECCTKAQMKHKTKPEMPTSCSVEPKPARQHSAVMVAEFLTFGVLENLSSVWKPGLAIAKVKLMEGLIYIQINSTLLCSIKGTPALQMYAIRRYTHICTYMKMCIDGWMDGWWIDSGWMTDRRVNERGEGRRPKREGRSERNYVNSLTYTAMIFPTSHK